MNESKAPMEVTCVTLTELFNDGEARFHIPFYQRKYAWDQGNCEALWEDIEKVIAGKEGETHFFGNVTLSQGESGHDWQVVDGQQRLTTFSLLLRALQKTSAKTGKVDTSLMAGAFLRLHFEDDVDQKTYRHLMLGHFCEAESVSEPMIGNFNYFKKKLEALELGNLDFLEKLLFVKVKLPANLPPQRIFERMNGTLHKMEFPDLIKNFLLLESEDDDRQKVYEKLERHLGEWTCWLHLLALMQETGNAAARTRYKAFKQFYDGLPMKVARDACGFLTALENWIEVYTQFADFITELNGGRSLRQDKWSHYAVLMMKIAVIFPDLESDRKSRDRIAFLMVNHLRGFIACDLNRWRYYRASDDFKKAREVLRSSSNHSQETLMTGIQNIFTSFPKDRVDASIRRWFDQDPGLRPTVMAWPLGIEAEESNSADTVIARFHEIFSASLSRLEETGT